MHLITQVKTTCPVKLKDYGLKNFEAAWMNNDVIYLLNDHLHRNYQ